MIRTPSYIDPAARILMAALFLLSGLGKLGAASATQAYMSASGVPTTLFWPTALFEIGAATLLVLGLFTRPAALLLAGFSLLTAFIFHHQFSDQMQMIMFLKNLGLAGGFLLLAKDGAVALSLDGWRARRAVVLA
jgi:putative oxidoreductase